MTSSDPRSLTPSQLNREVRSLLESHYDFLWVDGEVSNFAAPSSGHWYFSLKDEKAQVRCALFRNRNQRLRYRPQNGDAVRLRARVSLYEGRGEFQLIGEFIEPAGAGALQARFEALRDRLRDEGLFDAARKRPLPARVAHLAIITSPTGAALQDVLTVLARRDPLLAVTVLPAAVQGEQAAAQICAQLARANRMASDFDAVLLTRGGGSLEDLWTFNEEAIARAIAASGLPVVSAVGHETDVTIADFAADVRAPTPSAAAELLSGDQQELLARLAGHAQRLHSLIRWRLAQSARDLEQRRQRLRHPGALLREQAQRLDDMELRMGSAIRARLARREHALQIAALRLAALSPTRRINAARGELAARRTALEQRAGQQLDRRRQRLRHYQSTLQALDPLSVLGRGFALLTDEAGRVVRDSAALERGARLQARLARGELALEVLETGEEKGSAGNA
jgi:exodeoxyribonuclease VII large subunit